MQKVKRLPVKNIEAAIKAYYGTGYIGNKEIGEIFGTKTPSTIYKLKKVVLEEERSRDIPIVVPRHINTKIAFEVWNINISELEHNYKKLKTLALNV